MRYGRTVLLLLPPSEGKGVPADADPVSFGSLVLPGLTGPRQEAVGALVQLCEGPPAEAAAALGLTEGQRGELDYNRELLKAPAEAAALLYRGVLYDALGLPRLRAEEPAVYARARQSVLIFSALWGVLRPEDRVPRYRCSAGVKLPRIGVVTTYWKRALAPALAEHAGDRLVVDLRSSAYAPMWKGTGNTVAIRVLHEREVGGRAVRTVVSHFNKATKGRLAAALLRSDAAPATAAQLVELLRSLGFTVEPGPTAAALDVVVSEL